MRRNAVLLLVLPALAAAVTPSKRIGDIKQPAFERVMCELYVDEYKTHVVLLSDMAGEKATLNIDGKDVILSLKATTKKASFWSEGELFTRTYEFEKTPVIVSFQAHAFQGPEGTGGSLEGWPMEATITIGAEPLKTTGSCGAP